MSLTEQWNKGTLKVGWYYVKLNEEVYPDYYDGYFVKSGDVYGLQVLAPCDYDELQRLKEEHERGCLDCDYLAEYGKMRQLLRECKEYLSDVDTYFTKNADEAALLLTRINEVLK